MDNQKSRSVQLAFVGGMTTVGMLALFSTLISNLSLWAYMSNGLTLDQAYGRLFDYSLTSPAGVVSQLVLIAAGYVGGRIAAHGKRQWIKQAVLCTLFASAFFGAMALAPTPSQTPLWYSTWTLVLLALSVFVGVWDAQRTETS